MHPQSISRRYFVLKAEIRQRMTVSAGWRDLPALLDQLHTLRKQYLASKCSLEALTAESERLARRTALH